MKKIFKKSFNSQKIRHIASRKSGGDKYLCTHTVV